MKQLRFEFAEEDDKRIRQEFFDEFKAHAMSIDTLYPAESLPSTKQSVTTLRYQRVNDEARIERNYENAGYDVWTIQDSINLRAYETKLVDTGLRFEIPRDYALIVKERSSLAKQGIRVGGGVIDWSYRGNLFVCLSNTTSKSILIIGNKAIAQCILTHVPYIPLEEISVVSDNTNRGSKGFGSTDKN